MATPQFIEEKPLSLSDVQHIFESIDKRDNTLNFLSTKCKEYLVAVVPLSFSKKQELHKKLVDLKLTRLKEEHFVKIIDFLPATVNDLKIVLQAYPLSMPKKDQEAIVALVKEFTAH